MAEIFEKDENTIGWDNKDIGKKLPQYSPEIIGATDRIFVLSPVHKKVVHYLPGAGIVTCTGGKCCELDKSPAKERLGVIVFKYDTDRTGNLSKDQNGDPIVKGELTTLIMTDSMYARFRSSNERALADSDGKEHLNSVDTMISVDTEHKKKWKQWDITLSRRSYFLQWAKGAKSEKNPDGSEEIAQRVAGYKIKMKKLWEQLKRELSKDYTDEELMAKIAKEGTPADPSTLPDVGDPTDALGALD